MSRPGEVDYATLGAFLLAPHLLEQVRPWLQPADFAEPLCGRVYELLLDMHDRDQAIDPVTVLAELRRTGQLRSDGWPAIELIAMIAVVPTASAGVHYARLVLQASILRSVQQTGQRLIQIGQQPDRDVREALRLAAQQAEQLAIARSRWRTAQEPTRPRQVPPRPGPDRPGHQLPRSSPLLAAPTSRPTSRPMSR